MHHFFLFWPFLGDLSDFLFGDNKFYLFEILSEIRAFSRKLTFFAKN